MNADIETGRQIVQTLGVAFLLGYFFPTIVALLRRIHWGGVFVLNLLLGWSVLGWIAALVIACGSRPRGR